MNITLVNYLLILPKRFFTVCASLLLYTAAVGQTSVTMSLTHPKYSFTDTVRMVGVPSEELYSRAWRWFEEQSKTDPHFLEEANTRQKYFVGTSSFYFQSKNKAGNEFVKGKIYYLVKIRIHEGYYVYEFTDFIHQGRITFNTITTAPKYPYRPLADKEWRNMVWNELKESLKDNMFPIIGSLRASMQRPTEKFTEIVAHRNSEIPLEDLHKAVITPAPKTGKYSTSSKQVKKLEGDSNKNLGNK